MYALVSGCFCLVHKATSSSTLVIALTIHLIIWSGILQQQFGMCAGLMPSVRQYY